MTSPQVTFERVRLSSGHVLDLSLGPGLHVFHADAEEVTGEVALHELCALLVGARAPRRGRVRVFGRDPRRDPATRRRIVSVLGDEPPLIGRTVQEHLTRVLSLLGYELAGECRWVEAWGPRPAATLHGNERRLVAAAIALSAPEPGLAVFHEPERLGGPFESSYVLARLNAWREAGVLVVCSTTDARAAERLGARALSLSQRARPPEQAEYLVRSDAARRLAGRLADHPAVTGLRFDAGLPRDLWVRGADVERLADAIQEAVLAEKCELYELTRLRRTDVGAVEPGGTP